MLRTDGSLVHPYPPVISLLAERPLVLPEMKARWAGIAAKTLAVALDIAYVSDKAVRVLGFWLCDLNS